MRRRERGKEEEKEAGREGWTGQCEAGGWTRRLGVLEARGVAAAGSDGVSWDHPWGQGTHIHF